ncbi:MAG: hypothetical protein BWY70_01427 [Bacteroidetes bacterium ADurb.Bin408]|nr:MAG: hypothetical protein BWY70_01427 [Bacteroidetes bacterium ADurb.Bin408]
MDKATAYSVASKYIKFLIKDKKYDIKKAYLFGSYAKEKQHKDSSVDIEPHPISEEDFIELNPLASEILKTGVELPLK